MAFLAVFTAKVFFAAFFVAFFVAITASGSGNAPSMRQVLDNTRGMQPG